MEGLSFLPQGGSLYLLPALFQWAFSSSENISFLYTKHNQLFLHWGTYQSLESFIASSRNKVLPLSSLWKKVPPSPASRIFLTVHIHFGFHFLCRACWALWSLSVFKRCKAIALLVWYWLLGFWDRFLLYRPWAQDPSASASLVLCLWAHATTWLSYGLTWLYVSTIFHAFPSAQTLTPTQTLLPMWILKH